MKELSDEFLKTLFMKRLEGHETETTGVPWEKIEKDLPPKQGGTTASKNIYEKLIAIFLVVVIFITPIHEKNTHPQTTKYDEQDLSFLYRTCEGDASTETELNQTGFEIQSRLSSNGDPKNKRIVTVKSVDRISEIEDEKPNISFFDSVDYKLSSASVFALIDNVSESKTSSGMETSTTHVPGNSGDIMVLNLETHAIDSETLLNGGDTIVTKNIIASEALIVRELPEESDEQHSSGYHLKIIPYYNTGYFVPIKQDNIQVKEFDQAERLNHNRIGIVVAFGYSHRLLNFLEVEYSVGYKYLSKKFDYVYSEADNERSIQTLTKSVDAKINSLTVGLTLKKESIDRFLPVFFSVNLEHLLGKNWQNSFPYSGKALMVYGIGVEKKIDSRFSLRPGISYGVPLNTRETEHFVFKPINWNIEVNWSVSRRNN